MNIAALIAAKAEAARATEAARIDGLRTELLTEWEKNGRHYQWGHQMTDTTHDLVEHFADDIGAPCPDLTSKAAVAAFIKELRAV